MAAALFVFFLLSSLFLQPILAVQTPIASKSIAVPFHALDSVQIHANLPLIVKVLPSSTTTDQLSFHLSTNSVDVPTLSAQTLERISAGDYDYNVNFDSNLEITETAYLAVTLPNPFNSSSTHVRVSSHDSEIDCLLADETVHCSCDDDDKTDSVVTISKRCAIGSKTCAGVCVNIQTDVNNCGQCKTVCPAPKANEKRIRSQGVCGTACKSGWGDCDSVSSNGCEKNLLVGLNNCGSCGNVCPSESGTPACANGVCTIICDPGFGNCNNDVSDGCEATTADNTNCGTCGNTCPSGSQCTSLVCLNSFDLECSECPSGASVSGTVVFSNAAVCSSAVTLLTSPTTTITVVTGNPLLGTLQFTGVVKVRFQSGAPVSIPAQSWTQTVLGVNIVFSIAAQSTPPPWAWTMTSSLASASGKVTTLPTSVAC